MLDKHWIDSKTVLLTTNISFTEQCDNVTFELSKYKGKDLTQINELNELRQTLVLFERVWTFFFHLFIRQISFISTGKTKPSK